jgi:hypothetical protein
MHSDERRDERELDTEIEDLLRDARSRDDLCEEDIDAIRHWQTMANVWHDEVAPSWTPPPVSSTNYNWDVRTWFPMLASASALVLVAVMFVQQQMIPPAALPSTSSPGVSDYNALPPLPQATQAAIVETVLESSRDERQEELEWLMSLLKAHMDKRALETEDSLRYVIASQVQGQKELEDLYQRVEELMDEPASATPEVSQ